ncbi:hypothetical protein [Halohasta litorea]|uniref:Uncharacterized protein n=1 Tax=Halohasta litorea TaxID=869891 RepID=A0ABD6DBG9_9EURY|nr:hypothetical protein [Halohasta litorea]
MATEKPRSDEPLDDEDRVIEERAEKLDDEDNLVDVEDFLDDI